MRFSLDISIDDDLTRKDLARNLRRVASTIERQAKRETFEEGDGGPIRDIDNNLVGEWEIRP